MGVRATVSMTVKNFTPEIEAGVVRGMNLAAERLLTLSTAVAPIDQGTLIASGQVEPATNIDDGAAVVYDTPYAARLHEHPEYQFQNGRQGKYLEEPAVQNRKELGDIIRREARSG